MPRAIVPTRTGSRRTILVACLLPALWPLAAAAQFGTPQVRVEPAIMTELAPNIPVPGTVYSRNDARLSAEVEGTLVQIAEVGEWVKQGDLIARIEDTIIALRRDENEGVVAKEKSRVAFLKREVGRLSQLASQNIAAKRQLDETESDLAVASNDLTIAQAQLEQVKDQLRRTRVNAPFDGRVTERFLNRGERVSVGDHVVRLISPRLLEVIARVPLASLDHVAEGNSIQLTSDRNAAPGVIRTIVPFGDSRSHMFEIRIDVEADAWVVGENVRLSVPTAEPRRLLAVPRDALILRRDGASVFRIGDDDTAQQIEVVPGLGDGTMISVTGELSPGDQVVVRGGERLSPGAKVEVLAAESGSTSSSSMSSGD